MIALTFGHAPSLPKNQPNPNFAVGFDEGAWAVIKA